MASRKWLFIDTVRMFVCTSINLLTMPRNRIQIRFDESRTRLVQKEHLGGIVIIKILTDLPTYLLRLP